MINKLKKYSLNVGAAFTVGMMLSDPAHANNANNFNSIANNITSSISDLPGLLAGMSYLAGVLMGALGILKVKDHVENPSQTPLKEGAIRLTAGGALFALPIVFEAMQTTIAEEGGTTVVNPNELKKVDFSVAN